MYSSNKKNRSNLNFLSDYVDQKNRTLKYLDLKKILEISNFLEDKIKINKKIFICGNGGSASIANHFLCDFNKGIKLSSNKKFKPKIFSLSNSLELITAISNDISYNKIFSFQLENYASSGDVLIAYSCSGKSKNIEEAIKMAKKLRLKIIFFVGFYSKKNIKDVDFYLSLQSNNYGICEDIFQSIMHMISQNIRQKFSIKNL
jgi:D-sedoheptulose 7-phosphate isomerase